VGENEENVDHTVPLANICSAAKTAPPQRGQFCSLVPLIALVSIASGGIHRGCPLIVSTESSFLQFAETFKYRMIFFINLNTILNNIRL
jgi:hypothetical protein